MTRWVLRLIVVNGLVFLLSNSIPGFQEKFLLIPVFILQRPWTVFTYMFLHDGIWHIFFNMLALFFFGPRLEMEIGGRHFLTLYFFSGLMAAALSFVFTPNVAIVGASGAIFGVLIGYGHFWPRDRIFIWGIIPIEVRFFILIMTALSLFGGFSGEGGNIAHFAHLGGFLGGWLYIQWYSRRGHHAAFQQVIPVGTVNAGDLQRWNAINREALHEVNREEYDRIMMKLRTNGPESMTLNERQFLNRFSQD